MSETQGAAKHAASYDLLEPSATSGRFECRVSCTCGDFERTSTSKVSAAQARSNARTTYNRHVRDRSQQDTAAESAASETAQRVAASAAIDAAEQAARVERHRLAEEQRHTEEAVRAETARIAAEVRLAAAARRAEDERLAEEADSAARARLATQAGATARVADPAPDDAHDDAHEDAHEATDPEPAVEPEPTPLPTPPIPATTPPEKASASLRARARRGVLPALVLATVAVVIALLTTGGSDTDPNTAGAPPSDSAASHGPTSAPSPTSTSTTAPPTTPRAFVAGLRALDPVFDGFSAPTLVRAGQSICTFYETGQDVVQIIASIGNRGSLDPRQSAAIVRLSSPVFCPQFVKPMFEELDGLE